MIILVRNTKKLNDYGFDPSQVAKILIQGKIEVSYGEYFISQGHLYLRRNDKESPKIVSAHVFI